MEKEKLLELLEPQAPEEILDVIRNEVSELHPLKMKTSCPSSIRWISSKKLLFFIT